MTDLTKLIISAKDEASAVFGKVQGAAERLQGSYARLAGLMSTAIGVGSFAVLMKGAIDAGDEMFKLSQKTGMAIGELSALKYAADLSGVGTDTLGKGIKALNQSLVAASDSTSKQAQLFRVLGVDVAGGPSKAIDSLARAFAGLKDGEVKATLATEIFKKAGVDMIPLLNQGEDGIRKMKEEAQRLGLVFTDETAKAAEQFNDNMRAVRGAAEGAARVMLSEVAPSLVRVSQAMKQAAEEGGVLYGVWVGLGGALAELLGMNDEGAQRIRAINKELARLNAEIRSGENAGVIVQQALIDARAPRIKQLEAELRILEQQRAAEQAAAQFRNVKGGSSSTADPTNRLAGILSGKDSKSPSWAEREIAAATKALTVARAELANGGDKLTQSEKRLLEIMEDPGWAKATEKERESIKSKYELAAAAERAAKSLAFLASENNKNVEAAEKAGEAIENMVNDLDEQAKQMEFEATLIGKTNVEREKSILLRRKEGDLIAAAGNPSAIAAIEEAYRRMYAAIDNKEFKQNQLSFWTQLADVTGDFFADLVMNGKSAFDGLKRMVKQLLAEMIALFAKRWVLQMAGVAGGATYGSDSLAGGLLNAAGSYMSGGGTVAGGLGTVGLWTGIGAIIAAAVIANERFYQQGWRADGQDDGALRSGFGFAFDADRIARGIGMSDHAASLFSGSSLITRLFGHRARQNDAFGLSGNITGAGITGQNWQDWSQAGGTFRSDIRGTDTAPLSAEQSAFLNAFFAQISNVTGRLGTALGVDPAAALAGYSRDFNFQTSENGDPLSDEAIGKLLNDLMGEVLQEQVALLMDAGGNGDLAEYIRSLTGEGEALAAQVMEFVAVMEAAPTLGFDIEAIMAMQRAGESLSQTLQSLAQAQESYYQLFFTAEENHSRKLGEMERLFQRLGVTMPTSRDAFRDLVESLRDGTDASAQLYRILVELSPAFAELFPVIDNTADTIVDATTRINDAATELGETMSGQRPWDDVFRQYYLSKQARESLAESLNRSLLGPSSPLDPMQQLQQAQAQYNQLLGLAQGGDINAISRLGGARDTLIEIARQIYGSSSPFVELFNRTFNEGASIAEVASINERQLEVSTDILGMLIQIRDGIYATGQAEIDATEEGAETVKRSMSRPAYTA